MCRSNQICWGSDHRGDSGVMRKWKSLPGGEEQLSTVVETQGHSEHETLPESSACVCGSSIGGGEGLWGLFSSHHFQGWGCEGGAVVFLAASSPGDPAGEQGVVWGFFLFSSKLGGLCETSSHCPPIALPTARLQGWRRVKHPSSFRLGCFSARLGWNEGEAQAQQKTLQFCAKFIASRSKGTLIQWVIACSY